MNVCISTLNEIARKDWTYRLTDADVRAILARYKEYVSTWNMPTEAIRRDLKAFAQAVRQEYTTIATKFDAVPPRVERMSIRPRLSPFVQAREIEPTENGARLLQSIIQGYADETIVQDLTSIEEFDANLHQQLTFSQIPIRVSIPRDWIDESNRVILVEELGASIALGERNRLRDSWSEQIRTTSFPSDKFTADGFSDIVRELSSGMNPKALLAPIEKYVEIASWIRQGVGVVRWGPGTGTYISDGGRELKIFWSNMYAPLDCFILVDPTATRWIVKPDSKTGGRLTATFVEDVNDWSKVDFYVKTVVCEELLHRERIKLFKFD